MTSQLLGDGLVGDGSNQMGNVGAAVRSISIEAAGVTYRIEIASDTVKFERARGMTFTLPLSAVLASAALLFNHSASTKPAPLPLARFPRRPLPERAGAPWSVSEDAKLRQEWAAGRTIQGLARMHSRTTGAIQSRLEKLGLISMDERQADLFGDRSRKSSS